MRTDHLREAAQPASKAGNGRTLRIVCCVAKGERARPAARVDLKSNVGGLGGQPSGRMPTLLAPCLAEGYYCVDDRSAALHESPPTYHQCGVPWDERLQRYTELPTGSSQRKKSHNML